MPRGLRPPSQRSQSWGSGRPWREPAPGEPKPALLPAPQASAPQLRPRAGSRAGLRPMLRPQSLQPQDCRAQCPTKSPIAPAWVLPPRCAGPGLLGTAWQAIHYPLGGPETPSPTFRALPKRNQDPCLHPWTPRPWLRSLGRRGVRETWVSRRSQPAPEVRRRRVSAGSPGAPGRRRRPQPTQPWSTDPTRARLEGHAAVAPRVSPLWGGQGGAGVRVRSPRPPSPGRATGNNFQLFQGYAKKKNVKVFTFLVGGFVCAVLKVGTQSKTFYLRMPLHSRPCKVFLLQGALGRKKKKTGLLSARPRSRIMKPKTFIL